MERGNFSRKGHYVVKVLENWRDNFLLSNGQRGSRGFQGKAVTYTVTCEHCRKNGTGVYWYIFLT